MSVCLSVGSWKQNVLLSTGHFVSWLVDPDKVFICRSDFSSVGCWGQIIRLSVRQLIGGIRLFVCLPACLPACLSVYMSVRHLNGVIRLSICLFIWLAETDCLSVCHLVGGLAGSVHQMFGGFSRSVYLFKYRSKIDLFAYSVDLTLSILTVSILLSCNRLTIFSFF